MNGLDLGLGALEQDMWRVVFLMTRLGAALLAALAGVLCAKVILLRAAP